MRDADEDDADEEGEGVDDVCGDDASRGFCPSLCNSAVVLVCCAGFRPLTDDRDQRESVLQELGFRKPKKSVHAPLHPEAILGEDRGAGR